MFKIGDTINTSLGQTLILDIKKDYLVLFNPSESKFIKANNYNNLSSNIFWSSGEYYNTFDELIKNLEVTRKERNKRKIKNEICRC